MRTKAASHGFSLIELMVGVTIGLIGCVIIFQVLAVNEGYKRSTTGNADAQVAGSMALYSLERDMRMAGYGLNDRSTLGCNLLGFTSTRTVQNYSLRMVPVQIHSGVAASTPANSDIISVNYGTPLDFAPGYGLMATNMAPGTNFRLENRGGIRRWDMLVISQPGQANCSLVNAVNLPLDPASVPACGGNNSTDAIEICAGTPKTDHDGVQRIYNPAGGLAGAPTFTVLPGTTNTRVFNFGADPVFNVYRVLNDNLVVCDMRTADCSNTAAANWTVVVENVVYLKAQYGMDTNDDGIVDTFDSRVCRDTDTIYSSTTGDNFGDSWATSSDTNSDGLHDTWAPALPSAFDWSRVMAIRLAIVVRSTQWEKIDVSPTTLQLWPTATSNSGCNNAAALTNAPSAGPVYTVPDQRYRYRVFETVIPLRNSIWMPG
jgi:type IV pilus assembly protein PilW